MKLTVRMDSNDFGGKPATDYDIEVVRYGKEKPGLRIEFRYKKGHGQKGGQLRLPPNVAQWLGQALVAASAEATNDASLKMEVVDDGEIW